IRYLNAPDSDTGSIYPGYSESTIFGILVEKGGTMPSFAWGVQVKQDALLFTLDNVGRQETTETDFRDQIKDGSQFWEVDSVEKHLDPRSGALAFYIVHLNRTVVVEP
ncbi:MAG: hypothetical protein MUO67_23555, partial [Anaerolineales bacterium]|nr:hypothetical protein [Anaerolineales bacterium]